MERIIVQVKDKEKARMLSEFLAALDFVSSVETGEAGEFEADSGAILVVDEESSDFFSLAGLWEGRDVSLESIRQKAWPRQESRFSATQIS
jgi:hypothetical protein